MEFLSEALKWATRVSAAPGVAGLLGKGTAIGDAGSKLGPSAAPFGRVFNALGAGAGMLNARDGFAAGDADAGWDGVGQAANGTIGALTAGTPFGAAFATMRMLGDATGFAAGHIGGEDAGFTANSAMGTHYRGLFGDESVGGDVAEALGGGFLGHAAGTVVNLTPAGLTANGGDNLIGGVVNTLGNLVDSDDSEEDDYWGDAKGAVSGAASDAWSWITD